MSSPRTPPPATPLPPPRQVRETDTEIMLNDECALSLGGDINNQTTTRWGDKSSPPGAGRPQEQHNYTGTQKVKALSVQETDA